MSPYFDGCYFDPTYFDAAPCGVASSYGGRRPAERTSNDEQDAEEAWLLGLIDIPSTTGGPT